MRRVLRWIGYGLGVVAVALGVVYAVLHVRAERMADRVWEVPARAVAVVPDSAALARAEHYARTIYTCASCHGDDFAGGVVVDGPPGRFVASNLTPAGVGATYTDEDWDRAIRHGVRPDGRALLIMGADRFRHIPDEDFAALVAVLRSLPPVENDLPEETLRPLGRVLIGAGLFVPAVARFDHDERPPTSIEPDGTALYGRHLVSLSCVECHGDDLRGGASPDPAGPKVPTLAGAARWTSAEFMTALRTGVRPSGVALRDEWMPWTAFAPMTDAELGAIHAYLGQALATQTVAR